MSIHLRELETSTVTRNRVRREGAPTRLPGLTVLAHPDPRRVGERATLAGLSSGRTALLSRREPLFAPPGSGPVRPLADAHLSRRPLRLKLDGETGTVVIEKGDSGTDLEVDGTAVASRFPCAAERLLEGVTLLLSDRVLLLLHTLEPRPSHDGESFGLIGEGPEMVHLRSQIRQLSGFSVPVLLRGETGTGKDLVARALHRAGERCDRPFLGVNLGAIPPPLAAAELFGATEGALPGAPRERTGYFEQAGAGTLFLDAIDLAPPEVQVLLLRALETREILPLGAAGPIRIEARVLAATHADLDREIAEGRFQAPLLHRLGGDEIHLPPLREQREDLGRLFFHFLRQELEAVDDLARLDPVPAGEWPWISAALVGRLARYSWPGNVRQLRNVAGRLVIGGRGSASSPEQLVDRLLQNAPPKGENLFTDLPRPAASRRKKAPDQGGASDPSGADFLARVRAVIDEHLADEDFSVEALARHLAVSRSLLYVRLEELAERKPAQLLQERRLERAAELLEDGRWSVSEIAYRVGFRSVSHFSQRFREHFGKTPSAYRRS